MPPPPQPDGRARSQSVESDAAGGEDSGGPEALPPGRLVRSASLAQERPPVIAPAGDRKHDRLLRALRGRALVYAEPEAAAQLRELLLGFLQGGGYLGGGYAALRKRAQRALAAMIEASLVEAGPSPSACGARGSCGASATPARRWF